MMDQKDFQPVRIGVVGLGRFGQFHALTLAGLREAKLVALVARRQASLDAVADQLPGVSGWLDLDQAIASSEAEAWVVASSTASHVSVTSSLLEAGYKVLLEKPIAQNLADAQSLAPLVKPDSSNLMLGHILLFNSEFLQLRDEVQRRGPIIYINGVRHRPSTVLERLPGESPFHLTMVHDLYPTLALVNRAEPVHFSAQTHHTDKGECDLVLAQLAWKDGTIASFVASFLTPPGMGREGFDRMEVFGRGWTARLFPNPRPIEVWDDRLHRPLNLEFRADPVAPTGMLAEELRCFCRVVRGIEPVPIGATYNDAMQIQRWLDRLEAAVST